MKTILIHGLGQTSKSWDATLSHMKSEDILCPDLFGLLHGEVNYPALYSAFSDYCDNTEGALNLCGLSLGAVLALQYAIGHPGKVHSLALIAAQYRMPKTLLRIQNLIFRFMPDRKFEGIGLSKNDFIRLCRSTMDLDFRKELDSVKCPVLILCGENDTANKKASAELVELLPDARLHIIENSGHEVNADAPQDLAMALTEFFG